MRVRGLVNRIWFEQIKILGIEAGSAYTIGILQSIIEGVVEFGDTGDEVLESLKLSAGE